MPHPSNDPDLDHLSHDPDTRGPTFEERWRESGTDEPRVYGSMSVKFMVTLDDVAHVIRGQFLDEIAGRADEEYGTDYRNREEILQRLRQEIRAYGDRWREDYLWRHRIPEDSDAKWAPIGGGPGRTEVLSKVGPYVALQGDGLRETALIVAGEVFWEMGARYATEGERLYMDDDLREKYIQGATIRRVPESLTPGDMGPVYSRQFPGRPDWLDADDVSRCNRLHVRHHAWDPRVTEEDLESVLSNTSPIV